MALPLHVVIYDERAKDGTWCKAPYPDHPRGCPNFPKCCEKQPDFKDFEGYDWFAVIEEFDLKAHAEKLKEKHPGWTERQARCVLYWQNSVRKRLREKTAKFAVPLFGDIILEIPEACGVNLFATMAKHDLFLKTNPDIVYKIMMVGKVHKPEESKE